jgi:formylglycine-generating enzyme required for sulfatase activity
VAAPGSGSGRATGAAATKADSKPALAARPDSGPGKGPTAVPAGMVLVKGGTFTMGRDDGGKLEKPAHPCTVADFHLAEREVTREEFAAFLGTPAGKAIAEKPEWKELRLHRGAPEGREQAQFKPAKNDAQLPVVRVTWEEADTYCRAAGRRLPTEAEWEYAARGAGHTSLYPGGELPPDAEHANYTRDKASPAALRPACKPLDGLRDMIGNAGEWTADLFGYYTKQCGKLRTPPVKGKAKPAPYRVIRGGGFDENDPTHLTATYRIPQEPSAFRWQSVGFRCALTPGTATP